MNASCFFVRGLVFSDPQPPRNRRTVKLDADEVPDILKRLVGKAVGEMHTNAVVGVVMDAHHNRHNDVLVDLIIDTRTARGKEARRRVRSGMYGGLSFRSLALLDGDGIRHTSHYPFEVALVEDGAVERSSIVCWADGPDDIEISKSGYMRVFTKSQSMSPTIGDVDESAKRTKVMEAPELDAEQLKMFMKVKPLFDALSENNTDVNCVLNLAGEAIENRKRTMTSALTTGMGEYVKSHLPSDEYDKFKHEIVKMSMSGDSLPVLFTVAASAIHNYQQLLSKGETTIRKSESASVPGLPSMMVPQASELRVPKSDGTASLMKRLEQNGSYIAQYFNQDPNQNAPRNNADDIGAKLEQAKARVIVQ